jgi:hypothetical protein
MVEGAVQFPGPDVQGAPMKLTQLAALAKKELDKRGGVQAITNQAKSEYDKRGGADGLKATAKHVADATKTGKTPADKAKAAAEVLRQEAQRPGKPKK